MVDYCANPTCMKPLHYLREGTVYIFNVPDSDLGKGKPKGHKLEHYWLCGVCSATQILERTPEKELRLIAKKPSQFVRYKAAIAEPTLVS